MCSQYGSASMLYCAQDTTVGNVLLNNFGSFSDLLMPAMLSTLNLTFCAAETVVYITAIYASSYNYTTIRSACLSEGGGGLQGLVGSQSV